MPKTKERQMKTNEKPDYFTAWENFCEIMPELSKRCNLGADKYAKFDWRTQAPEYFWKKLFRHMKTATIDLDSVDEDGLPHITAMWFHISALVWKKFEQEKASAAKPKTPPFNDPEFLEFLEEEDLSYVGGVIYYFGELISPEDQEQIIKDYYDSKIEVGEPEANEDTEERKPSKESGIPEVVCGTLSRTRTKPYNEWIKEALPGYSYFEPRCTKVPEFGFKTMQELYFEYTAGCQKAQDRAISD